MRANRKCPKCGSMGTWWEQEEGMDLYLRCVCGLRYLVYSQRGGVTIERKPAESQIKLPRTGSKLKRCLSVMAREWPEDMTTQEVAKQVGEDPAEAASRLMILSNKGLITRVVERRGVAGGSTWALSNATIKLMSLK